MKQIIIATKNRGKAKEFKEFFSQKNIEALSLLDIEKQLPDVDETGDTFEENASLKAEEISHILNKAVLSDDSGLVIDALDGRPGVYSARYAGEDKDDEENVKKVLKELENIPEHDRNARFVCVLAIARPEGQTKLVRGECEGKIALFPSGDNGFGYDPIFIPDGYQQTMAELEPEEKNQISHRKLAMDKLDDLIDILF
ncbi:XTP/dITP diphosphatase [Oceanobacillus caeni]|uniref:XTP/dITP diphosphatase n=1 Tax=Oceanobacillus TaxID=182709 RepID=UPI000622A02C|nr:XTP/dITP diphosphatase [Oceanobacillus caeni]KKE80500.1 nucleoside-triphosphate diphosphatase [Bacilli bacterium VT-13-104]PZD87732.1 XTP/dITP diphosphatase [Bacilli bacterium]MBU8789570.1 XTP/dITP diphosphatase [Oceanobacillus caeni]MCR1835940.1 XTP/dITP diphosphatase [Oceanobacillus caeni]PZD89091.1 XTP/dITP diphosphatase [Bacilli bacterium]